MGNISVYRRNKELKCYKTVSENSNTNITSATALVFIF